jgi:hypothetical protein
MQWRSNKRERRATSSTGINWAEEMDQMGLQGEYTPNYSPTPAPPSPGSMHPPLLPKSDYKPPCTQYRPPHAWYNSPWTHHMPRHAPFCPQRERHPPRENRTSHVTATRRERFCATTHVEPAGPPKYRPPALCNHRETPYRPQRHVPWSQEVRRDLIMSPGPQTRQTGMRPAPTAPPHPEVHHHPLGHQGREEIMLYWRLS